MVTSETSEIHSLVQPFAGLFRKTVYFQTSPDEPRIATAVVDSGDVSRVWPHIKANRANSRPVVSGAGTGLNQQECVIPAIVEGLERYCSCVYSPDQFVYSTAEELGNLALDLDMVPRCSESEISHARCPLVIPDKKAPMRWVQGLSLLDGRRIYVPAVMAYMYAGFATRDEQICVPISTGCAAHTSYERAILNGILEVIERDAISLVWLQKLPLPAIELDVLPAPLSAYWELYRRGSEETLTFFFDATTDIGIPTVYGLQVTPSNPQRAISVACSTSLRPADALAKVIRDMAALQVGHRASRTAPENLDDFTDVSHGATYMSHFDRYPAFDFLQHPSRRAALSTMKYFGADNDNPTLRELLNIFRRKHIEVYAVDLSTDEAVRCGIRAVRVIIPALQPLGFYYRARYLGHPRLYAAPLAMGYPSHPEAALNAWPQPFD